MVLAGCLSSYAQEKISWMSFEDLESQQEIHAKNILIYFYADWCTYCKKMDRVSFASLDNTTLIEKHYYAVKFNVENPEEVQFQDGIFRLN